MLNNLWRNHGIAKEVTNILELGSGRVKFHNSCEAHIKFCFAGEIVGQDDLQYF